MRHYFKHFLKKTSFKFSTGWVSAPKRERLIGFLLQGRNWYKEMMPDPQGWTKFRLEWGGGGTAVEGANIVIIFYLALGSLFLVLGPKPVFEGITIVI